MDQADDHLDESATATPDRGAQAAEVAGGAPFARVAFGVAGVLGVAAALAWFTDLRVEARVSRELAAFEAELSELREAQEMLRRGVRDALGRASKGAGALRELEARSDRLERGLGRLSARLEAWSENAIVRSELGEAVAEERLDALEDLLASSVDIGPERLADFDYEREEIEAAAREERELFDENSGFEVVVVHDRTRSEEAAAIVDALRSLGFRATPLAMEREELARWARAEDGFEEVPELGDVASLGGDEKLEAVLEVARRHTRAPLGLDPVLRPRGPAREALPRPAGLRGRLHLFLVE